MRRLKLLIPGALFLATACGELPESTEQARGVFSGLNIVLAMSVLVIVLAVGLIVAAMTFDRIVRTRRALAEGPPAEIEEEVDEGDEVVAGITVGRAPVPRWLYAAYVLIPLFAFAYVFSNVRPPEAAVGPTPTPIGPCEECEIAAVPTIKFDKTELPMAGGAQITVAFSNDDTGVPHTFTVWETKADASGGGEPVADSGTVAGGAARDVKFESPDSGTWYFNCTLHPAMEGDIPVEG